MSDIGGIANQLRARCDELTEENGQLRKELDETKREGNVRLPLHVAAALAQFKKEHTGEGADYLAWRIPNGSVSKSEAEGILYKYANEHSFLDLVNALQYGFDDPIQPVADIIRGNPNASAEALAVLVIATLAAWGRG